MKPNYTRYFYEADFKLNLFTLITTCECEHHYMSPHMWDLLKPGQLKGRSCTVCVNNNTGTHHFKGAYLSTDELTSFKLFLAGVPIQTPRKDPMCLLLQVKDTYEWRADMLIAMHHESISPEKAHDLKKEADVRYAELENALADLKSNSARAKAEREKLFKCPEEKKAFGLGHLMFVVYTLATEHGMVPAALNIPSEVYF